MLPDVPFSSPAPFLDVVKLFSSQSSRLDNVDYKAIVVRELRFKQRYMLGKLIEFLACQDVCKFLDLSIIQPLLRQIYTR